MSVSTNVPPLILDSTGVTIPDEAEVLAGALSDINSAFGGNLNTVNLSTPQGQLASSLAAVIGDKNDQFAYYVGQIDPDTAEGKFQDAIGRIYFIERNPALSTVVPVTCSGVPGTFIPPLSQVRDADGFIYRNREGLTIEVSGSVIGDFYNIQTGPIACGVGVIDGPPFFAVPGWESAYNASAGTLGRDVENRADFEFRRRNSVAANAHGSPAAIKGAVLAVPDVLDVYVQDNPTGADITVGSTNKVIDAHSVYVAVVGGTDDGVAQAIWSKKDLGCSMVGNTSQVVEDTEGYSEPYPAYTMVWERPAGLAVKFAVNIQGGTNVPPDAEDQIKAAIVSAFGGGDNGPRARVGAKIYALRYATPLASLEWRPLLISLKIGTTTANLDALQVGIDQRPTISPADIAVTITPP